MKILENTGSPPCEAKVMNVTARGSDIGGTSYSTAKRYAKVFKIEKEEIYRKNTSIKTTRISYLIKG